MIEVLLVLKSLPDDARCALVDRLQETCSVVSAMGSRLVVARVAPHGVPALRALPGVMAVIETPADLATQVAGWGFSDTEALFASAWAAQGQKKGPRLGEGLDWDAPGFQPPGHPKR